MIEFFLSKVWAFIFGVAVITMILSIFHTLNSSARSEYAVRTLNELSATIDELGDTEEYCRMRIPLKDVVPKGGFLIVQEDVIRLNVEDNDYYSEITEVVVIEKVAGKENEVRWIRCLHDDTLVVISQQEETKIYCIPSTSSSIESTSLSQSPAVLYM